MVKVMWVAEKFFRIMSSENSNDTLDWFKTNAKKLEIGLAKAGYMWMYMFETIPHQAPMIYMFFDHDDPSKMVWTELMCALGTLPEDRRMYPVESRFEFIDLSKYDNTGK